MKQARVCDQCHGELPGDAPEELCPKCLLKLGGAELGILVKRQEAGAEDHGSEAAGRKFGNYEVLEKIAQGGMGAVYKARQLNLDRVVALKLLPFGQFSRDDLLQRFRSEASAAAALQHPNIVAVHDVGEHDGQPFFSMDFVEGRTLAELVRDQPLSAKRAAAYLKTIAEAVHYAHQHGILHRDLKPSNILIDTSDQPRITDFGLAKRLGGDSDLTLTGQVLGSPNFISPEQAEGRSDAIGPPSDVYSLGALLYHLLTRQPPFQADTLTTLLKQVLEAEPVPPRSLNPSIPKDLETICLKCLEKDIPRRYPTAQALADDLGRFLCGEPIRARPVSTAAKAWKWCRRRPALAGMSAALVLTLLGGLAAVLWQLQRTRASQLIAQQGAYAADMNLAQAAVENGDLGAAISLLDAHRPAPGHPDLRGWEWRYLWQRCRSDELFELTRSAIGIDRVAFSPDGRWLAVRDGQATLALWDIGSRRQVRSFKTHGYLDPFAFSNRGELLGYYAAGARAVSVVSLDTGQEIARLPHTTNVAHMAFSADAARLFTLTEDGTLTGWVIASRQPFRTAKFPGSDFSLDPRWLVFSPDGGAVAFRAENGLGLWELESGKQTRVRFTGTQSSPTVLSFSPDGKLLAAGVGDSDSEVYVWAVQNLWGSASTVPPPRGRFGKHRDWICDVAFAPDNSALVSASADSTLCVWQMDGPEVCRRYRGHRHQVLAVAWSPDGQRLVSSGEDGTVRVWDPCREPATSAPTVFPAPVYRYNFRLSGDGKSALILEPTNRMAVLWDAVKLQPLEPLAFAGTNLSRVAWSADGRKLATGDELGDVRIWDLVSRQAILNVAVQGYNVRYLEFSPNGQILLCGALRPGPWDRITKLWDLSEGREIALPREAMTDATWADFSPDCRLLAVLHFGGALDLWEIRSGRCRVRLTQPLAGLKEEGYVAFSPDGRTWASSTQRGVLALWDAAGKQPRTIIPRTTQELWDLSFSADGTRLLVSGKRASDAVRLLDVTSKRFVATLSGKADVYWFSRMTADNSTVYAVGEKTVLLWRAPSWAEIEAAEKGRRTP